MKNGIRVIALLLVLGLLAGCGNGPLSATDDTAAGTTAGTTGESTGNTNQEITVNCQYLPQVVENPNDLPVLKWVCLMGEVQHSRIWNEAAATELNQMLADRNMPFRVQFVLLTTNSYFYDSSVTNLFWFDYPEAIEALEEADLIYGGMNGEKMVQYLSPITEYVTGTAKPSLENAVAHEADWMAGTVDGEIYGYNTRPFIAQSMGWVVDSALLQAAGLKPEDLQREFWDMDDILARLYAANEDEPFLYLRLEGMGWGQFDYAGTLPNFTIGSVDDQLPRDYAILPGFFAVDYSQETPVVINWLETETTRKVVEAVSRYAAAGYAAKYGEDEIRLTYTAMGGKDFRVYGLSNTDVCIPVTAKAYYTATEPEGDICGVAAVSQHKAEAISLLNLIAEDEAFRMQLFYGKEGRDYKLVDGYYEINIHDDDSNYSLDFLSPLAYFCGLTEGPDGSQYTVATENGGFYSREGKTALETYQEILDECAYYYPIVFDYSGIEQELAAMQEIFFNKYDFLKGQPLTEKTRQRLVEDLKAAGSDKVLEELQRQLTQWQKNNPD